ncbi:MAG: HEAT repeat domain-containing protein [Deltaproteobacteria bacterium]|nr:HEAT repeat domain-containing protein [Deltaproteobacteria bacterium]
MKFRLFIFLVLSCFPLSLRAFLDQDDPDNFWKALDQAPQVALVKVLKQESWKKNSQVTLLELEVQKWLKGMDKKSPHTFHVFYESFGAKLDFLKNLKKDQSLLVNLAPLPRYDSYQELFKKGPFYRFYGQGQAWAWLGAEDLLTVKNYLKAEDKTSLLLNFLKASSSPYLAIQAADRLAQEEEISLPDQGEVLVDQVIRQSHDQAYRLALIRLLARHGAKESNLKKIAKQSVGEERLLALGLLHQSGKNLPEDFYIKTYQGTQGEEKLKLLAYLTLFDSEKIKGIFKEIFAGSDEKLQKRAVLVLSQAKPDLAEAFLLKLAEDKQPLQSLAMLSLINLSSPKALEFLKKFITTKSPQDRDWVMALLKKSPHTKAYDLFKEDLYRDSHGHWVPKTRHPSDLLKEPPHLHEQDPMGTDSQ